MSLEEQAAKGRRAAELLEDAVLRDALAKIENDCVAKWRIATDPAQREQHWMLLATVEELRRQLRTLSDDGHIAQHQITRKRKAK